MPRSGPALGVFRALASGAMKGAKGALWACLMLLLAGQVASVGGHRLTMLPRVIRLRGGVEDRDDLPELPELAGEAPPVESASSDQAALPARPPGDREWDFVVGQNSARDARAASGRRKKSRGAGTAAAARKALEESMLQQIYTGRRPTGKGKPKCSQHDVPSVTMSDGRSLTLSEEEGEGSSSFGQARSKSPQSSSDHGNTLSSSSSDGRNPSSFLSEDGGASAETDASQSSALEEGHDEAAEPTDHSERMAKAALREGEIPDLHVDNPLADISAFAMHPRANYVAVGLLNGEVEIHEFVTHRLASHAFLTTIPPCVPPPATANADASESDMDTPSSGSVPDVGASNRPSCTALAFSADGSRLYRAGGGTLERFVFTHMDAEGRFERDFVAATRAPIRCMLMPGGAAAGDALIVGDEDGTVSVYDFSGAVSGRGGKTRPAGGARDGRAGEGEGASMGSIVAAGSAAGCEWCVRWAVRVDGEAASGEDEDMEPITALLYVAELGQLVVASGGGSVCVLDPQNGKQVASVSIPGDDEGDEFLGEPLALEFVENGCQLLVAFQSGAVLAWRWGEWDMVAAHAPAFSVSAVNCLVSLDETQLLAAGDDGVLRVLSMHPPRVVAVLATHASDVRRMQAAPEGELPVEQVVLSRARRLLCFCAHDSRLRFMSLDAVDACVGGGAGSAEEGGGKKRRRKKKRARGLKRKTERSRRGVLDALQRL